MKVLVLGGGGREHALVAALQADPHVQEVIAAPGNPGMGVPTLAIDPADPAAVIAALHAAGADPAQAFDLVVVGPELPLVNGVADAVRAAGVACFGPSAQAALLEGSKAFAKQIMAAAAVPTAMARVATTGKQASDALDTFGPPYVVKDDGLAAGKGVVVTTDRDQALGHALKCLEAGSQVVIEEFLDGPEVSLFVLCDGTHAVALAPAQDFKRVGDGDRGPNTGGMGAYSPLPWAPADLSEQVLVRVARPVVAEMARRGTPFMGVLYCGLALTSRGLRVVEFNVRFGDPETQCVLARLQTPLGQLLYAAATGALAQQPALRWSDQAAVAVVLAAAGYPEQPRVGHPIHGLAQAQAVLGARVLHAGTKAAPVNLAPPVSPSVPVNLAPPASPTVPVNVTSPVSLGVGGSDNDASESAVVSSGGRVLAVVGTGIDLAAARTVAYEAMAHIELEGSHYRHDIARLAALGQVEVPAGARS